MVEITPTKTETKLKKTTTIAAMIVAITIIASPMVVNKHAFAATTTPTAGLAMLKLTTPNAPVVIPLVKGLYDGKDILFITTEVSDKAIKAAIDGNDPNKLYIKLFSDCTEVAKHLEQILDMQIGRIEL